MKKIFTLFAAFMAMTSNINAQMGHGEMVFVGKSDFYVTMMGAKAGETTVDADTLVYAGANFTLPSMKYNDMVIPSFTIEETTFSGGYSGVTWEDQTFTSSAVDDKGNKKDIKGTSLKGTFTHGDGIYKIELEVSFKYGSMPFPITYSIESYYVKEYSCANKVTVGGQFGPYSADVVCKLRTYMEEGVKMMDVEMPTYGISGTPMGDLTIGRYTVKGLTMDEAKGGYYRDYAADGLTMHFTATNNGTKVMDDDYALSSAGNEILVVFNGGLVKITNNFKPGSMPFPISAVMEEQKTTGVDYISNNNNSEEDGVTYNLMGQRVDDNARGIVIRNGKKRVQR